MIGILSTRKFSRCLIHVVVVYSIRSAHRPDPQGLDQDSQGPRVLQESREWTDSDVTFLDIVNGFTLQERNERNERSLYFEVDSCKKSCTFLHTILCKDACNNSLVGLEFEAINLDSCSTWPSLPCLASNSGV